MPSTEQSAHTKKKPLSVLNVIIIIIIAIGAFGIIGYKAINPSDRATKIECGFEYDPITGKLRMYASEDLVVKEPSGAIDSEPSKIPITANGKEPAKTHKKAYSLNIALNKPVVELFLNIKKYQNIIQFNSIRLASHVQSYERYSVNSEGYPFHLTDGNHDTSARPGGRTFDYIIDLKKTYRLSEIMLHWGDFGLFSGKNNYITSWELYGQDAFSEKKFPSIEEDWELIKKGDIPGKKTTQISKQHLKNPVRRIRIRARSEDIDHRQGNWIGIYEIEAYGTLLNAQP